MDSSPSSEVMYFEGAALCCRLAPILSHELGNCVHPFRGAWSLDEQGDSIVGVAFHGLDDSIDVVAFHRLASLAGGKGIGGRRCVGVGVGKLPFRDAETLQLPSRDAKSSHISELVVKILASHTLQPKCSSISFSPNFLPCSIALGTSLVKHPSTSLNAADAHAATNMTLAKLTLAEAADAGFLLSAYALGLT